MLHEVLVAVVAFGAGCGVTAFGLGRRRRKLPAPLQESITAFGEELRTVPFTAEDAEASPEGLVDYRHALSAYERAAAAKGERDALAALGDGRAALIRLAARRAGRPVPIDALPPLAAGRNRVKVADVPKRATGERFLTVGGGRNTVEVLIDRPEPGRPAIVEVTAAEEGRLSVVPVVRTESETYTGDDLLGTFGDGKAGRVLLWPRPTHLRIESSNEQQRWSVRIRPLSAAPPLGTQWRGGGAREVLFHDGGPATLTVQARSKGFWRVDYTCECLRDLDCRCREPRWPNENRANDVSVWSSDDGRRDLRLPRPGYLTLTTTGSDHEWYLSVEPVSVVPEPPRKARRPNRRSSA